jgi:hypothetical protein
MALETKFHELITLTLRVAHREVCLGLSIGGTDNIRGLVNATLELPCNRMSTGKKSNKSIKLTFVSTRARVRILGVDFRIIAGLAISTVGAV